MVLDVLALQYLYGKNKTTNSGDTKFDLTDTNYYLTLWDASGNDTVDASGDSNGWTIRLPAISLSTLSDEKVGFALPTYEFLLSTPTTLYWLLGDIENIKGTSFNDDLIGNSLSNVIDGSAGNDKLKGAEGNDNLIGGLGLDTAIYIGKYNEYSITYSKATGVYTVTDNQANRDGIDTLYGVEYIQFSDTTVNVNNLVFNSTYRILAQKTNYDEGSFALFSLVTTNVAAGTTVNYSVSGISSADLISGNLTGTTVVGSDGTSTISIGLTTDNQTEGPETLTVTVLGNSASVTINDTSVNKGPAASDLVYVFKSEKTGPAVNPASYSYYYTSNLDEVKYINAQANWPWVQKASTFEAAHSNPSLSTPVFKFWSDKLQAPYFTISTAERDQIISWSSTKKNGYDWLYAGTGFSVYTSSTPTDALGKSAIPVYCVWMDDTDFNPANGLSGGLLFTADKVEYDGLVKLVGVTGVGAVFYGEVPGN